MWLGGEDIIPSMTRRILHDTPPLLSAAKKLATASAFAFIGCQYSRIDVERRAGLRDLLVSNSA